MWLARAEFETKPPAAVRARRVVVAVPACNEAASITACLAALDTAAAAVPGPVTILVGANNCRDATAAVARGFASAVATVVVDEFILPPERAHAGGARRQTMDRAAALAGPAGVVMTTDADSCVDAAWLAANLAEIDTGADAVAGMITFDAAARAALPDLGARALEWRLAHLHARLEDLVDPRPHDPWPRHIWAWGASLAVTVAAYRAVGGVPIIPLAEDRALADAIDRAGFRLRRSHAPLVFTSPRRTGRAPGGFADLLASYADDAATPCDAALEPTRVLARRLRLRARLRAATPPADFAARWDALQAATPGLARRRLRPAELAGELALAERFIAALERRAARRCDSPAVALAA